MASNFTKIEKKWQKRWEEKKIFQVKKDSKKKKFYVLEMYPYPSGSGLHMGHAFNYTIGDIYALWQFYFYPILGRGASTESGSEKLQCP